MTNTKIQHYLNRDVSIFIQYESMPDYFEKFIEKWNEEPIFAYDPRFDLFRIVNDRYNQYNDERDKGIANWLQNNN